MYIIKFPKHNEILIAELIHTLGLYNVLITLLINQINKLVYGYASHLQNIDICNNKIS